MSIHRSHKKSTNETETKQGLLSRLTDFISDKKDLKKLEKEATEKAEETFENIADNIEDSTIDSATEKLIDKVEDSIKDTAENSENPISDIFEETFDDLKEGIEDVAEENPIDINSIISFDSDGAEEIDEALNHSAELTEALNQQKEAAAAINEVISTSELNLAGATTTDTIATEENNIVKGTNAAENIADAASEGALSGAKKTETIEENKNTLATIKNTAAKIANAAAKHPLITATVALTAVTIAAAVAIYKYNHRLDNTIKENKKLLEEQKELLETSQKEVDATNEKIKSLNELIESYKEAVEGSSEYYELANKIAELDPSLVIGYTSNGDAILTDTERIYEQIEAYKELKAEQIQEKKENAQNVVDTSADLVNNYKTKNNQLESQLKSSQEAIEELRQTIENEKNNNPDNLDYISTLESQLHDEENFVKEIQEQIKSNTQDLKESKTQLRENLVYLFEDIPDDLSDQEKEYEKAIRQFAIDIANANEEALDSADFISLYENLKTDESRKALTDFFKLDANIPHEKYQQEAQKVYDNLIKALLDNKFELDEEGQVALKIALKIDGESEKNYQNQRKKFINSVGFKKKDKNIATSWYDNRTAEELKLIEDNIDKFRFLKYIDAEHLEESLDNVLDKLKKANDEIEDLSYSLSDFEEKENEIESLQSLYNQFVENVEDGQVKVPLDISDVEGLREKWEDIVGKENFEEFELTVTTEGFEDEYQKAFDKMLSKYLSVQISMRGATKETATMMKSQLKMDGLTEESADNFVNAKMAEAKAYEFTERAKQNDKIITQENIDAYIAECEQLGIATDLMGDYLTEAMLVDGISIEGNDEWLDELAEKLGLDISLLKELKSLSGDEFSSEAFNPNKGEWNGNFSGVSDPKLRKILLEKQQENIKAKNDEAYEKGVFDLDKAKEAAGKTGEEAGDAYVEEFEKSLQELDDLHDAGILSEKDYLDRLKALYIKYFANRKEYIKEFAKYEKQYLEGMQSLYSAAISAAITLLNDEKEDIEKAKDDALDALDDAKQNEIDPINDHIKALENERDALQKERDALQEANDEREREMNLQKAQYELERANKQRTRLIYKNGQMQYVNDYQEVRNAKKNVEDAIFDKKVAAFDKQISNLDDQIDNLNKQLDEIDERYQQLIDDTEKFYDEQVRGVQDLIDMWEKLQHQADLVEAYEALNNFGISAQDILSGNIDVFNQIRDGYIGTFAGLHQDIDAVSQAFGTNVENAQALKDALLGYDESTATFAQLKNDIDNIGNSASDAASQIGNGTEETSEGTLTGNLNKVGETVNTVKEVSDALNGSENSLKNAVEDVGNTAEEVVPRVKTLFESLRDSIVDSVSVLGNMPNVLKNAIDDAITGTGYHKTVDGGAGLNGTAYANGNWTAGSKGIVGKSLVGELGPEVRVRNGKFEVLGSNGAEFADIKPNDIIFNHKI